MIWWNWNWSGRMFDYHGRHVCSLWKFEVSCCDMGEGSSSQCCGAHCSPSWSSSENQTTLLSPAPPVPAQRSKAKPQKYRTAWFLPTEIFCLPRFCCSTPRSQSQSGINVLAPAVLYPLSTHWLQWPMTCNHASLSLVRHTGAWRVTSNQQADRNMLPLIC